MCPWCWLTPVCPCGRGGGSLFIAMALVSLARRVRARFFIPDSENRRRMRTS